jgi:hypothetical protein
MGRPSADGAQHRGRGEKRVEKIKVMRLFCKKVEKGDVAERAFRQGFMNWKRMGGTPVPLLDCGSISQTCNVII